MNQPRSSTDIELASRAASLSGRRTGYPDAESGLLKYGRNLPPLNEDDQLPKSTASILNVATPSGKGCKIYSGRKMRVGIF